MKKERQRKRLRVVFLFVISLVFVGIAAAIAVVGYNYVENRNFQETFYCVSSLKLNNKIRVIQISDLHSCTYGEGNSELIDRVKKLEPDLIIYTGDIIDSQFAVEKETADPLDEVLKTVSPYAQELIPGMVLYTEEPVQAEPEIRPDVDQQIIDLCAELAKIAPSYYVYGNNEVETYYDDVLTQDYLDEKFGFDDSNRDPQALIAITDPLTQALEAVGVNVLKNTMATVTVGATTVDIFGVLTSNPSSFWSYAGQTYGEFAYTNEDHLKIMAIHEPLVFEEYEPDNWADLMLAGHTHGGTVRVPLVGPLYTQEGGLLPQRKGCYIYGRYDVQGRPLIVSCGLENSNIFRINNMPELVIIDINKF